MSYGTKVQFLTLLHHVALITGLTIIVIQAEYFYLLIGFISYLIIGIFGANIGMHRYLCHRSFKTSFLKDKFLKYSTIFVGWGSPISWCALHRHHHAHSDTDKDIQSPKKIGSLHSWFSLYPTTNVNPKLIIDLMRDGDIQFIHKNYFKIVITIYTIVAIYNPLLATFLFSMPAALCFHGAAAIGVLTHLEKFGYKVTNWNDDSVNSPLASLISLGEGWHNYHHSKPNDHRHGYGKLELDPSAFIIEKFLRTDSYVYDR